MDYNKLVYETFKDDPKRLNHIIGVKKRALELGKLYHADLNVLEVAALLHDITKNLTKEEHLKLIKDKNKIKHLPEPLIHTKSALYYAKNLGINDLKILEAIEFHGFGKKKMNLETMILAVADYTEETRTHKEAKIVYEVALTNIKEAFIKMLELTIHYLTEHKIEVSAEQLDVLNYYKGESKI